MTLGQILKRNGIKQVEVVEVLLKKYGHAIAESTFNQFCKNPGCGYKGSWGIVRMCLENDFGIVYGKGGWNKQ